MCSYLFIKTILNRGGLIMPNENTDAQNTMKYSIWNTRTDEKHIPVIKDKFAESIDKPNLESKTTDNRD